MKGDIPAALDLEHSDPAALQLRRRQRKAGRPAASSEGDDWLVFHEQQQVFADLAVHPAAAERTLQLQHLRVAPAAEVLDHQPSAHPSVPRRRARRARTRAATPQTARRPNRPPLPKS